MKIEDYRKLSVDELQKELLELKREQFTLRIRKGTGDKPKSHLVLQNRRSVARIKTVMTQKKKEGELA